MVFQNSIINEHEKLPKVIKKSTPNQSKMSRSSIQHSPNNVKFSGNNTLQRINLSPVPEKIDYDHQKHQQFQQQNHKKIQLNHRNRTQMRNHDTVGGHSINQSINYNKRVPIDVRSIGTTNSLSKKAPGGTQLPVLFYNPNNAQRRNNDYDNISPNGNSPKIPSIKSPSAMGGRKITFKQKPKKKNEEVVSPSNQPLKQNVNELYWGSSKSKVAGITNIYMNTVKMNGPKQKALRTKENNPDLNTYVQKTNSQFDYDYKRFTSENDSGDLEIQDYASRQILSGLGQMSVVGYNTSSEDIENEMSNSVEFEKEHSKYSKTIGLQNSDQIQKEFGTIKHKMDSDVQNSQFHAIQGEPSMSKSKMKNNMPEIEMLINNTKRSKKKILPEYENPYHISSRKPSLPTKKKKKKKVVVDEKQKKIMLNDIQKEFKELSKLHQQIKNDARQEKIEKERIKNMNQDLKTEKVLSKNAKKRVMSMDNYKEQGTTSVGQSMSSRRYHAEMKIDIPGRKSLVPSSLQATNQFKRQITIEEDPMKFVQLMQKAENQNKDLEKLHSRFNQGVGQGSKNYMNAKLKERRKKPKVMFQAHPEPGSAAAEYDSPLLHKRDLSPSKALERMYEPKSLKIQVIKQESEDDGFEADQRASESISQPVSDLVISPCLRTPGDLIQSQ